MKSQREAVVMTHHPIVANDFQTFRAPVPHPSNVVHFFICPSSAKIHSRMKILNVLLLVVFASSASAATCRRHHAKIRDKKHKLATAFESNREAVDEVIEDEYLIMRDKGVDPRVL